MKTLRRIFLLAGGLVMVATSAWAEDSSDLFLRAYQDFQAGEKFERDGRPREALACYQKATKSLDQIKKSDPSWQPPVVEYRSKKARANIERLTLDVTRLSLNEENPEGPLPQTDSDIVPPPPVITTTRRSTTQIERGSPSVQSSSSQGEIVTLRKQLSDSHKETERLQEKLTKQSAELKSALFEVDKTKVNVVELKAQLAQAQDAFDNSMRDRDAKDARRPPPDDKRINELNDRIKTIEADNEVLLEENGRLVAKLEGAAKYIDSADQSRKTLDADRQKIVKQRNELGERVKGIEADNEVLIEENGRLVSKLENAKKYIDSADQSRKALDADRQKIIKQRDEAIARTKRIKENSAQIERLAQEKAEMEKVFAKEKKDLEVKLAAASDHTLFDKVSAENKELAAKLADAEQQLGKSASKQQESESVLANLRSEINGLNDRLLEAQAQVSGREEKIKALADQLDKASGELARLKLNSNPTTEDQRLLSENDLLRGIILRQIKEHAERENARVALEKEIQTLQIRSDNITQQLSVLAKPAFRLNADEQALFEKPVTLFNEPEPSSLDVSVAIAKPSADTKSDQPSDNAQGLEALPDSARNLAEQARNLFDHEQFAEAEKLYEQIVQDAPNNYFALANLGVTQIQSLKLSAAETALKKAVSLNPKDAFAATNLGIVYCKQGHFDDAITTLQKAVAADSKDHVAYNYLGVCYAQKGLRNKAEECFKKSIAIRDDYADAHFNLAVFYATTEPPIIELAKQHYQKATSTGAAPDASMERLLQ